MNLMQFSDEFARLQDKFEDNKGVIRSLKSKDRQQNGRKKKYKRINNDLQNIIQKTKDRATRTPLIPGVNSCAPEVLTVLVPQVTPVTDERHEHHLIWKSC